MICVGYICDSCKHASGLKDGWKPCCAAFPDGIPNEHIFYADEKSAKECNDGIGYEKKK